MKQGIHNPACVVNQVKIEFTQKPITAWGGLATLIAKFLEVIESRQKAGPISPSKRPRPTVGASMKRCWHSF